MKISVIIPVYNSEKYLCRCVDSVKKQTYTNWEMILVDDGSSDLSGKMIDEYSAEDARIIAIHQSNSGAGEARNKGIEAATGDYVVFIDSDDYIDADYFSLLAPEAIKNDIVFINSIHISTDGKVLKEEILSNYKSWEKDKFLRAQMTGKISWGGWTKAVKLELLRNNNVKYTSHSIGEEALYSFQILYSAEKVGFLDEKPLYYYVIHEGSLSRARNMDPWGEVAETIADYLKRENLYQKYADAVNAFRCTAMVVSIDKITQFSKRSERKSLLRSRMKTYDLFYDSEAGIDLDSMSMKAKVFVPFLKREWVYPVVLVSKVRQWIRKK